MRPSTLMRSAAALAVVGIPFAVEAPAHAGCEVTHQAGVGLSASIQLGKKSVLGFKRRAGARVHAFYEAAPICGFSFDTATTVVPGAEIGIRHMPGVGTRGELLGRLGAGALVLGDGDPPGHLNAAVVRIVGGASIGKGVAIPTVGFDARTALLQLRVSDAIDSKGRLGTRKHRAFLDVGTEVGLVPVAYGFGLGPVDGRPLRDGAGRRRPVVLAENVDSDAVCAWLDAGRDELEAVTAFLHLAEELHALGAPRELVGRCLAAADDEAMHVWLCLGRAAELGAGEVVARPLQAIHRPMGSRRAALARLALESWRDGYLNEGRAADELETKAHGAGDDRDARIYARIAAEERQHAILGRDIATWCAKAA